MKAAVILGASGQIGSSIAEELAADGWSLYLQGFTHYSKVQEMASGFSKKYPKQDFFPISFDMSQEDDIDIFVSSLFQVDAIVFAQGLTNRSLLTDMTATDMDYMWKVHIKIPLLLVQKLQAKLTKSGRGRIVFISSVYGNSGSSMEVFYSMTKGAQDAFVKSYSKEVASMNLTVNAIAPGAIETSMNGFLNTHETRELIEKIPVGRMGRPSDVSFWVQKLLMEESSYMTGQILTISGGWLN